MQASQRFHSNNYLGVAFALMLGLAVGFIMLRPVPVRALAITSRTFPSKSATTITATITTDIASTILWCVQGWPLKKFYPSAANTTSSCMFAPSLDNGWISSGTPGGTSHTFTIPHLPVWSGNALWFTAYEAIPPFNWMGSAASNNQSTLAELKIIAGPTSSNVQSTQFTGGWTTSTNADSRLWYTDQAPSWREQMTGGLQFNAVDMAGNSLAVVVGSAGTVRRKGADESWSSVAAGITSDLWGVSVVDPLHAYAVALNAEMWFTSDGARSWSKIRDSNPGGYLSDVDVAGSGPTTTVVAVGGGPGDGEILKSDNDGLTWTNVSPAGVVPLEAVDVVDAQTYWAAGESGKLYRTRNGGATWDTWTIMGSSPNIKDVDANSDLIATIVTVTGEVYSTTDGVTFAGRLDLANALNTVVLAPTNEAWAFGFGGVMASSPDIINWSSQAIPAFGGTEIFGAAHGSATSLRTVGASGKAFVFSPDYSCGNCRSEDGTQQTAHTLDATSLNCESNYRWRVVSLDALNPQQSVGSLDQTVTTGICDAIPPTVAFDPPNTFTPPLTGSYTTTTPLRVRGTAADNIGVQDVTVSRNGTPVGTANTSNNFANWWIDVPLTANIATTVSARALDMYLNANTPPDPSFVVTYDAVNPTVAITSITPAPVNGIVGSPTVNLGGTAGDANGVANVTIRVNGGPPQNTNTANNYANWTLNNVALAPGPNTIVATAIDSAGRTGTDTVNVTYDNDDPNVTVLSHANNLCLSNGAGVLFNGTATDSGGVQSVQVKLNNVNVATNFGGVNWSATLNLQVGSNTIDVIATDFASHTTTVTQTLRYDNADPTVQIIPAPPATTSAAFLGLTGTAGDANNPPATYSCGLSLVEVRVDPIPGGYLLADIGPPNWQADVGLQPGANTIRVRVTDGANRQAVTAPVVVTRDNNGPTVTVTSPGNGQVVNTLNITVDGTATDNVALQSVETSLRGGPYQAVTSSNPPLAGNPPNTQWSTSVGPLIPGNNTIDVKATDNVALTGTLTVTVNYVPPDVTPPVISNSNATTAIDCGGGPADPYIDFGWQTNEASDTKIEYSTDSALVNGVAVILRDPVPPGTLNHSGRAQGGLAFNAQYYYRFTSKDAANNSASTAILGPVTTPETCDTTAPAVNITSPAAGRVGSSVNITARATDNRGVGDITFKVNGAPLGAAVDCAGVADCTKTYLNWDTSGLPTGDYRLSATAVDTATPENSATSPEVVVTVDNTVPQVEQQSVQANPIEVSPGVWQAEITWCTSEATDEKVFYGLSNAFENPFSPSNNACAAPANCSNPGDDQHCILLTDLSPNKLYYYKVESCDADSNCAN